MAVKRRAGKNGRMKINGQTIMTARLWETTERGDDLDGTSFESAGFEEGEIGVQVVEIRFELLWDAAKNPADDPPGLYPRADLAGVQLFENVTDNVFWELPLARVLECTNSNAVRGIITYTGRMKSQGEYFRPQGSV
jgi:hypothetical protein